MTAMLRVPGASASEGTTSERISTDRIWEFGEPIARAAAATWERLSL